MLIQADYYHLPAQLYLSTVFPPWNISACLASWTNHSGLFSKSISPLQNLSTHSLSKKPHLSQNSNKVSKILNPLHTRNQSQCNWGSWSNCSYQRSAQPLRWMMGEWATLSFLRRWCIPFQYVYWIIIYNLKWKVSGAFALKLEQFWVFKILLL